MVSANPLLQLDARVHDVPLVVDLEAVLLGTDLLGEGVIALARQRPLDLLKTPFWRAAGRGELMSQLARRVTLDPACLPGKGGLLAHLVARMRQGTSLVLVTDAEREAAEAVAGILGIFDAIIAVEDGAAPTRQWRHERLLAEFGPGGFDYLGSGREDLPLWADARRALLVAKQGSSLPDEVAQHTEVEHIFEITRADGRAVVSALRPHQWAKNLLLLLPIAAAHRLDEAGLVLDVALGIAAFSLTASSGYLFNDLMDLPSDLRHPEKKHRPLAAGRLPVDRAVALLLLLLVAATGIGWLLPPAFLGILAVYYVATLAYSLRLKHMLVLDVLTLAGLYGLRVLAGSAATGIPPSTWLLAFCMFLFFSLAMTKRYAELVTMRKVEGRRARARAYRLQDGALLAALGVASGYVSVLVLVLYIDSTSAQSLYGRQYLLWFVCFLLFYWISYLWLMTHRGRVGDDPTVFVVRDRVSRVLVLLIAITMIAAT